MEKSKKVARKTCCFAKTFFKKTQELIEVSQINIKIMQLKNKLERKLVKIGHSVYKKQKDEGLEGLKKCLEKDIFIEFCKEIDSIYDEIEKLEEELSEIKKDSICIMEYEKKLERKECGCGKHKDYEGHKENCKSDSKKSYKDDDSSSEQKNNFNQSSY